LEHNGNYMYYLIVTPNISAIFFRYLSVYYSYVSTFFTKVIIPLNIINCLIIVLFVFCDVGIKFLNIIKIIILFGHYPSSYL
jgi:hypothetical protein